MINSEIIKIATDTSNYGIKNDSNFIVTSKNKLCGDKITVGIKINKKNIEKMSFETESCIFCQASASLLSKITKESSIMNTRDDISEISKTCKNNKIILKRKYKVFKKLFKDKYKERYNCILLPFNALLKAINNCI
jgi:nitrogen fixation NifU-like protein